ncbi:transcriptional regulator [Flavobacteriaceae bacterium LMO-SS05]
MKHLKRTITFISIMLSTLSVVAQQKTLNSQQALRKYDSISAVMNKEFPESEYKTFTRASFSETQLETYLKQHFKRLDLLKIIVNEHKILKLDGYFHSGNLFGGIGFTKEAIKSYKAFFDYYKSIENELSEAEINDYLIRRKVVYSLLAENYAKIGALDSAAMIHKTYIKFAKAHYDIFYPSAINNYGLFFYWTKKDLDSALIYFKEAYSFTKSNFPQHTLIGSIRDNIADVYSDQHNYKSALPLYEANFEFYKHALKERSNKIDVPRLISAGIQLVNTNLQLNSLKSAHIHFKQLETIIHDKNNIGEYPATSMLDFLTVKENLLSKQQNIEEAYKAAKRVKSFSDSLQEIKDHDNTKWQEEFNTITLDRVALNFKIDRIQKENKIKSQSLKLWLMALIFLLTAIVLVGLFLSRRQILINSKNRRLIIEKELQYESLKNEQLQSDVDSKKRDLSDFALNLTQNQTWAKVLKTKIEDIKLAPSKSKDKLIEDLEQEIKNKVSFDSDTKDFFERVDKLSDAFYSQLSTNYPNLSKNEIRICTFIRLKMDSRSIANLQNITIASLNTSRYRVRKKLNLSEDTDLDSFIQNM